MELTAALREAWHVYIFAPLLEAHGVAPSFEACHAHGVSPSRKVEAARTVVLSVEAPSCKVEVARTVVLSVKAGKVGTRLGLCDWREYNEPKAEQEEACRVVRNLF